MKTVTCKINLYEFSELSEKAKNKAIREHWRFLNTVSESEVENEKDVIENIELNEYLFFNNGELAHCVTYTGKHPKAGITEFHLFGDVYIIN